MKFGILLAVTLLLNNIPLLFRGYDDLVYNFVYDVSQYSLFIFLFAFIFSITPRLNFKSRGISLVLAFMFVNLTLNTIYDKLDIALFYIQYPLGILLFSYLIFTTMKWRKKMPDVFIEADKTYFVFKKPKKILDFFITLFRSPVSSFSIVKDREWYLYTKDIKGLYKIEASFLDQRYYDVVMVENIDSALPETLLGKDWGLRKSNCVTVFKPVFESMNIKLGRFDFIPAIFSYKFFNGRYGI